MPAVPLPVPDLDPRPITLDQYHEYSAEKIELLCGYIFDTGDYHESRRNMLSLLLVNEGLEAAVRLAPLERWREALRRVEQAP